MCMHRVGYHYHILTRIRTDVKLHTLYALSSHAATAAAWPMTAPAMAPVAEALRHKRTAEMGKTAEPTSTPMRR